MALTEIPIELSSTPGIVDNSNATAITIDSSENVGIGTSTPSANLEITQSGNNVGLLVAGGAYNYTAKFESSDAEANIIIEDSNSTNDGNMIGVATNDMYFITNTSERMRIDSNGNVNIYGTDNRPLAITSFATASAGAGWDLDATSGNGIVTVSTGGSERMRIDSSGHLLLGTSGSFGALGTLVVQQTADSKGIALIDSAEQNTLFIENQGDEIKFRGNSANPMTFSHSTGEKMRLDSSGNLLVSKTASDGGVAGHELRAGSFAIHTRDNGPALYARRIGSGTNDDGSIQVFENADGQVGSIGTRASGLVVGSGDTGLFYDGGGDRIFPESPSGGAARDAAIDLGTSAARFKDLYLSGRAYINDGIKIDSGSGIYFGQDGTAANKLDDYEEGTWTASVGAGAISGTNLRFQGSYTKVGRQVFISLFIDSTSGATDIQISSYASIAGIPFTIAKAGTSTVITEDIDVYARQGFAALSGTTLAISAAGSSSGTSSLSIGIVGTTA